MINSILAGPFILSDTTHGNNAGDPEDAPCSHKDEISNTHQVDPLGSYEEVGSCINDSDGNLDLLPFAVQNDVEDEGEEDTNDDQEDTWIALWLTSCLEHSSSITFSKLA
jgi:hypothetical protein